MKLSCLPVSIYPALSSGDLTLGDWLEIAARLGLDGADVSVAHLDVLQPGYLQILRRQAEDVGVQIAMLVTYSDFTHPDKAERRRQEAQLQSQIEAASTLGAKYVRVTAGQAHPDVPRDDGIGWAVDGLLSGLGPAVEAGVTLAYENHTRGYGWHYNDFSQPAELFLEIVEQTEGSGLGVLFDTANNLAYGDDPLPVLQRVKHRVAVVHLNDIQCAGVFEPVLLGTGVAPVQDLLRVLVDDGFDGWVSLEEASNQGSSVFPQAIEHAREMWVSAGGATTGPIN